MSLMKIGGATAAAAGIGAGVGAYTNESDRGVGALRGAAFAAGATAGSSLAYKGLATGLDKLGYKEAPKELQDQMFAEAKQAFRSFYDQANSKDGLAFIDKAGQVFNKGDTRSAFTEKVGNSFSQFGGASHKAIAEMTKEGSAIAKSGELMGKNLEGLSTTQANLALLGGMTKSVLDTTFDYTIKPGYDFAKNIAKGSFKDLSVNQATAFASNAYGTYSAGAAMADASRGDYSGAAGHVNSAIIANGLQMKGSGLYNGVKAFAKSDMTLKGFNNTRKFSKYSSAYDPIQT